MAKIVGMLRDIIIFVWKASYRKKKTFEFVVWKVLSREQFLLSTEVSFRLQH